MSKNLNSELKKKDNYICNPLKRGVEGSPGALEHGPYEERHADYTNYVNHLLSNLKDRIRPPERVNERQLKFSMRT
jgi:hypothetical protein